MPESPRSTAPSSPDPGSNDARRDLPPRDNSGPVDLDEQWVLPAGAHGKPATIYVYGDCRPVVNGVAFAMAEMLDLRPLWLEVRGPAEDGDDTTAATAGWVSSDRYFVSHDGTGLESNDAVANLALWTIVRSDEPTEVLADLTDFLRLPRLLQEMIGQAMPDSSPRALVVANVERVKHLFPGGPGGLRRFLSTILNHSASLVVAHTGQPGEERWAFNAVFRVHATTFGAWSEGSLECEKGRSRGPFSIGRSCRLSDVPSVARVLAGLRHNVR